MDKKNIKILITGFLLRFGDRYTHI